VKNDTPHYGLKEHASVDVKSGLVLATTMTPASVNDTNYLPYLTWQVVIPRSLSRKCARIRATTVRIMRKDTTTAKITEIEIERNKEISKKRYIVEQYFGLSHLQVFCS
jgi:transposase, IS5 family